VFEIAIRSHACAHIAAPEFSKTLKAEAMLLSSFKHHDARIQQETISVGGQQRV
jgi:hypothetical protein